MKLRPETTTQEVEQAQAIPPAVAIPDGYRMDRKQRLVPVSQISEHDLLMEEFVLGHIKKAKELQEYLRAFKRDAFSDCYAFIDLLAEKYNRKIGGVKGNVTFTSFDGMHQIVISVQDNLVFGQELQIAKNIIDELLTEWSENANENLKAIIYDAFEVDQQGKLNTGRILSLRRLKIVDPRWDDAMKAIADSLIVSTTTPYLNFYEKASTDAKRVGISLDLAKL
ncbi:DUF3164 family protein [Shewanella halifaxensis]|uniref:DUF3164 family protein n=1 Tax=Shewanella halifaxensis TaxID=271098 RepID=UPI00191C6FDC|nr:DUF3164 family protein [Shewanella halifaxensis]